MRKLTGYIVSWSLYFIGDAVSKLLNLSNVFGNLYPLYNKIMCMSVSVQAWSGNETPWEKIREEWL